MAAAWFVLDSSRFPGTSESRIPSSATLIERERDLFEVDVTKKASSCKQARFQTFHRPTSRIDPICVTAGSWSIALRRCSHGLCLTWLLTTGHLLT
jgi:hypothetical protein